MGEIQPDRYRARYAQRTQGMIASEIRALFAVASRPEVVFLAGGMPYTAGLDFDAVSQVTESVIRDVGATALQYGGGQGLPELRERLVDVMAAEAIPAHADDLVVTSGGQQGLDLVAKLFCDPGDVILAEGPSYVGALGAFSAYQTAVVHVPMDEQGLIPDALEQTLGWLRDSGRTAKFLYTVPNHQNPAGVSLSTARRERLLELAGHFDLLVVEDNPYGLLDFKGEIRPALKSLDSERVVYVGTLSKVFAPGIRIGWVAAEGPVRDKLVLLKEAADLCHSNFTQYVAQRWLADQPWFEQVCQSREVYRERCGALLDALASEMPGDCSWSEPTGGFFVWARLPEGLDARELLARAIRARVAYVPGQAFYADGGGGDHLRLSFGFSSPERIREGVRRLAEVVRTEMELVRALRVRTPGTARRPTPSGSAPGTHPGTAQ
ncbi:MAG TPA: PLP-dependent aminotransferase family protein [Egibacteraceae bacterium]|nr:PLP-dependent aminotransferase family protein [Egibacteraceae bacterium]